MVNVGLKLGAVVIVGLSVGIKLGALVRVGYLVGVKLGDVVSSVGFMVGTSEV